MAAHLTVARALRPGVDGKDGMLARVILAALAGLQREAMTMTESFQTTAASDADRRWVRALRLRITGDWRDTAPTVADSVLERLEHARAVRERLGVDSLMDYRDTLPKDALTDWQRLAFLDEPGVEAVNVFTPGNIDRELAESAAIWKRFHRGDPTEEVVLSALNDRPNRVIRENGRAEVLEWGTWAAHQQRHLAHALISLTYQGGGQPLQPAGRAAADSERRAPGGSGVRAVGGGMARSGRRRQRGELAGALLPAHRSRDAR